MFKFSSRSRERLTGVHPDLIRVTERALEFSAVDFGITQGLRTLEQQRDYVKRGVSQTMRSRHLTGHAVDVVAYVDGGFTYKPFRLYTDIAEAFRKAAEHEGINVLWGAAWLRPLNQYPTAQIAMDDYVTTRRAQGRKPFMDGPHFQLTWRDYP
jgi:peptidoglycan L-alanyl-D-glutamate endopeptidase CwlK